VIVVGKGAGGREGPRGGWGWGGKRGRRNVHSRCRRGLILAILRCYMHIKHMREHTCVMTSNKGEEGKVIHGRKTCKTVCPFIALVAEAAEAAYTHMHTHTHTHTYTHMHTHPCIHTQTNAYTTTTTTTITTAHIHSTCEAVCPPVALVAEAAGL
jgi:hypothetical protein